MKTMKTLCKLISVILPFFAAASITYGAGQQTLNAQPQEQEIKQAELNKGTYRPIIYQKETKIDPITGETITKISRKGEKMYLLGVDYIYRIEIKENDRIHYWLENERWILEEKHELHKSDLTQAILKELNGEQFNADIIEPGQIVYLPDLDRNGLIVLNQSLRTIATNWPNYSRDQVIIEYDNKAYLRTEQKDKDKNINENRRYLAEKRGRKLTSDAALNVIMNRPKEKKEIKVEKDD